MPTMTAEEVRLLFAYDPDTGVFERRDKSAKRRQHTGTTNKRKDTSYAVLCVDGKRHYAHRLAWLHFHGVLDDAMVIDHIDGNGVNNRINNLRMVSRAINQRNRRPKKSKIIPGLYAHRGGFVVYFASKYAAWEKDFFDACCIRKSLEANNGYLIERIAA